MCFLVKHQTGWLIPCCFLVETKEDTRLKSRSRWSQTQWRISFSGLQFFEVLFLCASLPQGNVSSLRTRLGSCPSLWWLQESIQCQAHPEHWISIDGINMETFNWEIIDMHCVSLGVQCMDSIHLCSDSINLHTDLIHLCIHLIHFTYWFYTFTYWLDIFMYQFDIFVYQVDTFVHQ